MSQLLTPSISWDISGNNYDVSKNINVKNIIPILANPSRPDVSYNYSFINQATISTLSTYIPTPYNGQIVYLTDTQALQYYNSISSSWINLGFTYLQYTPPAFFNQFLITASSGPIPTPIYLTSTGATGPTSPVAGGYNVYSFTTTSNTATYTFIPYFNGIVQYLVVAGGGGGGEGGGGAGGYLTGNLSVTNNSSYTISVGAGGTGSTNAFAIGSNGSSSGFASISAAGGGYGGVVNSGNGNTGGSGGGGRRDGGGAGGAGNTPLTTPSQGNSGGTTSTGPYRGAAGGGGASAVGSAGGGNATPSGETGGAGGAGLQNSITGINTYYAGGGGGCSEQIGSTAGTGGLGGGGNGAIYRSSPAATPGTNGLGGGGGGMSAVPVAPGPADSSRAGNGGSGIVVIRFLS